MVHSTSDAEAGLSARIEIVRERVAKEGAEQGLLGYPVTDELDGGLGRCLSKFENGVIWRHPERGPWIELA